MVMTMNIFLLPFGSDRGVYRENLGKNVRRIGERKGVQGEWRAKGRGEQGVNRSFLRLLGSVHSLFANL